MPEGANYENDYFWTICFSMLKTGVCGEYGLHFCKWMKNLTCPLMRKACEVKTGIIKGALWRDNHKWYKTGNFNPYLYEGHFRSIKTMLVTSFCMIRFSKAMPHFVRLYIAYKMVWFKTRNTCWTCRYMFIYTAGINTLDEK